MGRGCFFTYLAAIMIMGVGGGYHQCQAGVCGVVFCAGDAGGGGAFVMLMAEFMAIVLIIVYAGGDIGDVCVLC